MKTLTLGNMRHKYLYLFILSGLTVVSCDFMEPELDSTRDESILDDVAYYCGPLNDVYDNLPNLFDNTIVQTHDTSKVASVEGVFEIDGVEYTLKRTAEIGWTRKKGRDEWERKGSDNYKFYIDHIERNAGDYKKTIEDLFAPIDKLKIWLE